MVDIATKELKDLWQESLKLLNLQVEEVESLCEKVIKETDGYHTAFFGRIYSRASTVGSEAYCLISNGLADGAMARIRALDELLIIAAFINKMQFREIDPEIGQKYLLHEMVTRVPIIEEYLRMINESEKSQGKSNDLKNFKKDLCKELKEAKKIIRDAKAKDSDFAKDYGWAYLAVRKLKDVEKLKQRSENVSLHTLTSIVNLEKDLRLFVRLGDKAVHGGSLSSLNSMPFTHRNAIYFGKNYLGLAVPIRSTSYFLVRIVDMAAKMSNNQFIIDMAARHNEYFEKIKSASYIAEGESWKMFKEAVEKHIS